MDSPAEGRSAARPGLLVLSYLAFLGLIPLALAREDLEVRWHARNGLLLFGAVVAVGVVATLIGIVLPALSCLYAVAMAIVSLLYVFIVILAVVKALEGQRLIIPGISRYASRLSGSG